MKTTMILLLLLVLPSIVQPDRPNFLFVIVDDLRPALGCYGDSKAHTPNLDRLARDTGVLFDKAYAQQALCAPSRNSLLTSRRPDTLGLYDFYSYWRDVAGNFTTLPQHLKNHGYTTASIGKVFHPGVSSNYSDDSPYSWSETPFHPYTQRYKDAPVCFSNVSNLVCPVDVTKMPNATLPDIEVLEAAEAFLMRNRKEPFFLAVGFQKPHIPLKYPEKYLKYHALKKFSVPDNYQWPNNVSSVAYNPWTDLRRRDDVKKLEIPCPWGKIPVKFSRKIIQSYYAAVTYVDDLIGKLLSQLDTLNVLHNTVIVVTSDHGWSLGEHSEWSKYSNFEVSLRVPLIVSIPNVTYMPLNKNSTQSLHSKNFGKPVEESCSKVISKPVELIDLFPTIAELAGLQTPKCPSRKLNATVPELCTEGSSLVRLIKTRCKHLQTSLWKGVAISQYPRPKIKPACKSSSDKPRLKNITIMGYTLRTAIYRYTAWVSFSNSTRKPNWQKLFAEELYDHIVDTEENHNLADYEKYEIVKRELKNVLINNY